MQLLVSVERPVTEPSPRSGAEDATSEVLDSTTSDRSASSVILELPLSDRQSRRIRRAEPTRSSLKRVPAEAPKRLLNAVGNDGDTEATRRNGRESFRDPTRATLVVRARARAPTRPRLRA